MQTQGEAIRPVIQCRTCTVSHCDPFLKMRRKGLKCVVGRCDIEMAAISGAVVREKAVVVKVDFKTVPQVEDSSTQHTL
jgi:hypothetical protein